MKRQLKDTKGMYGEMQDSDEREAVYEAKNYKVGGSKRRRRYEQYIIPFELEGVIKPMVNYILQRTNMEIDERSKGKIGKSPSMRRQYTKDPNKERFM